MKFYTAINYEVTMEKFFGDLKLSSIQTQNKLNNTLSNAYKKPLTSQEIGIIWGFQMAQECSYNCHIIIIMASFRS